MGRVLVTPQVDASLLAAADRLTVVGRAGVGLDNVDTAAATERGVIVANAPTSNSISAAEHTMAMILASARNVPQAHSALKVGRWERANWKGVELNEKTLAIVGLGNIGGLVAQRAKAFGMRLIGHDPFVSEERAAELGVELMELDNLMAEADFLTLHLARTPETVDLINAERLANARPNLRVVNVARGGIVNENDLAAAIRRGEVAGAAFPRRCGRSSRSQSSSAPASFVCSAARPVPSMSSSPVRSAATTALTLVANTDQPGMIALVATALGDAGINIDDMHIGRAPGADLALMVIATGQPIPDELRATIAAHEGITSVRSLAATP